MSEDRQLPQSVEMESAIVGAMLSSPRAIEIVSEVALTAAMFVRPDYRVVFDAAVRMYDRGEFVDELTVANRLKADGLLSELLSFADVLALPGRCPAVANARAYAVEVRDQAILRSLVRRGEQIAALGYERPGEPVELLAQAGRIVDEMTDRASSGADAGITTVAAELQSFVDAMQERYELGAEFSGITTGLERLDQRTRGLKPGELTIIAGRPGMGKSALAAQIAEHLVFGCGEDVYSVNLEMRERQQIGRLMARHGSVNLRAVRGLPTEQDVESAAAAALQLYESAARFHMDQATDLTVAQIRQRARRLQRELKRDNRRLALIVVDYLQLITPPPGDRNETSQLTVISRGLKSMALELGVHVIALSQLNRGVEDRQPPRPRLADLRGSGSIEQDADVVVFLFRPEYYFSGDNPPPEIQGLAEVIFAKMREGEPGTELARWEGSRVRFTNWNGPVFYVGGNPG